MKKEASCVHSKVILDYIKANYKDNYTFLLKDLDPEISSLKNQEVFLRDPNNWVSCEIISKLLERAELVANDPKVPYKIAKYAIENTSLGYIQRIIVKAFWSYKKALKHAQKINDKLNRNRKLDLVEIRRNRAIIRLHWFPHMMVTKGMCLYNQGIFSFMPLIWNGSPISIEEKCCYLEGSDYCEYHLRWPTRNRIYEIFSRFFTSKSVLKETIREMEVDKEIIEKKYEEARILNEKLDRKVKQLTAIQETGKAILSVLDLDHLLNIIMNLLSKVCRINRAVIMLANEEKGYLEYIHGIGFGEEVPEEVKNYRVALERVSNILARVSSTGKSEYVHNVKNSKLRKENILIIHGNPSSVYVVPLITRSKVIGVIATDAVDEEGVPVETRDTLDIFAPQIAIAIENARLYTRLQEQMEEIKRSQALLSRAEKFSFLGNLSARLAHEIKNPMTSIGTFIQMLPGRFDDKEFREEFYNIAIQETNRVNNLINELLDLVKTRESRFELGDIHDVINKMVLLVSPQHKAKEIKVSCNFDPSIGKIKMDPEKMKQVILNLLFNAVEHTPEKGRIDIFTLSSFMNGKRSIRIEIKDNGPGIPRHIINKIFDPYFTTKHKSTMHSGTGLGLFIAHQNMQDHGGSIEVKNVVDGGTRFILGIPSDSSM